MQIKKDTNDEPLLILIALGMKREMSEQGSEIRVWICVGAVGLCNGCDDFCNAAHVLPQDGIEVIDLRCNLGATRRIET